MGKMRFRLCLWALVAGVCVSGSVWGQSVWLPEMLDDAELTDVFFLDADRGWAVGDRGVVWRTEDGGRKWRKQETPVPCRLESVVFLNAEMGWAVGGWIHPYTQKTTGVVLFTKNGGQRWRRLPAAGLPALSKVRFFDGRRGWAVGAASPMYSAGIFQTADGGKTWSSIPGSVVRRLLDASFLNRDEAVAVGAAGAIVRAGVTGAMPAEHPPASGALRAVRFANSENGWAVGDDGLVLQTLDGGKSWRRPPTPIPPVLRGNCDFHTAAVRGEHLWVAGSPGGVVLHTGDGGQSWQVFLTDQTLPLWGLHFIDVQRGWAVGALGVILATRDGGRSWRPQQGGGRRAAVLGVFGRPQSTPLELFARLSGDEGYLGVAAVLAPEPESLVSPVLASACGGRASFPETMFSQRWHHALVGVGASGTELLRGFPAPDKTLQLAPEAIVHRWGARLPGPAPGAGAASVFEARLVRLIRQWRPEIVVTEPASPRGRAPLAHVVNQAVLSAAWKAGRSGQGDLLAEQLGLPPWKVKRIFSSLPSGEAGSLNLVLSRLAPRLGRPLEDVAAVGRYWLDLAPASTHPTRGFRLLVDETRHDGQQRSFFAGLPLASGGPARRALDRPAAGNLAQLRVLSQKRRLVQQLVEESRLGPLSRPNQARRRTGQWSHPTSPAEMVLQGLSPQSAGDLLFDLGWRLGQQGRPADMADAWVWLVRRSAQHPLSEAALARLVQYYASEEAAVFGRDAPPKGNLGASADDSLAAAVPFFFYAAPSALVDKRSVWSIPADRPGVRNALAVEGDGPSQKVQQAAFLQGESAPSTTENGDRYAQRAEYVHRLRRQWASRRPMLFAEPQIRLSLAAAARKLELKQAVETEYQSLARLGNSAWARDSKPALWSKVAATELWLLRPRGRPPQSIYTCAPAKDRPRLDGRLDDELWRRAETFTLRNEVGEAHGVIQLGYDEDFLYLAVRCRKMPDVSYPASQRPRVRDGKLKDHDRVEILLDIDRDYATWYQLTVDHRGWTGESCLGDASWNPQWYVASSNTAKEWFVEAALPLEELHPEPLEPNEMWSVRFQRIVPGVGYQTANPTTPFRVMVFP